MSDNEATKKMLRSVLQSSKAGVSISSLQSEYRSLCGESIPLKKLGFSKLEDYLQSIPSVVRLEYRMGEWRCFATVCQETAHIAELVAKQKSSKKCGHSQVVNCRMRRKPSNPYMLNAKPRSSLRQPSAGAWNWPGNRTWLHGGCRGFSASGDFRQLDQRLSSTTPLEHRQPAVQQAQKQCVVPDSKRKNLTNSQKPKEIPCEQVSRPNHSQSSVYDRELVQRRITQLLEKHYCGLWMSKLSEVYCGMFNEKLHPQVLKDLEKWTHVCMVEQPSSSCRADRLVYPPLPPKPCALPGNGTTCAPSGTIPTPNSSQLSAVKQSSGPISPTPVPKPRVTSKNLLAKPTFIYPPQPFAASSVSLHSPAHNPALAPQQAPCVSLANHATGETTKNCSPAATVNQNTHPLAPKWTYPAPLTASTPSSTSPFQPGPDISPHLKDTSDLPFDSARCPLSTSSAVIVSADVRQKLKELLSKYSHGLWVNALPSLFMDTYKTPFPEHILDNLSHLLDICNVEYPNPRDKKKAILYNSSRAGMDARESQDESQRCRSHLLPSGIEIVGSVVPACLALPSVQYPSVLVTDAKSSNKVTIRYVGEGYSNAQEDMEDIMRSFYNQSSNHHRVSNPVVGQLVAVWGVEGDELARAQVTEVMSPNNVKVYYMDYGFSVETVRNNLLELHQDFLSLPFQATNIRLAGLEVFNTHPLVLSSLEKLAVEKILLMETLEPYQQNDIPQAVLYDTSLEDDININSTCLKALQDETMNNPLTVTGTYQDVCVTNVCSDGIIYCQLSSRGTARLNKLLEETEAFFMSQVTSEPLVSRPFTGKFCVARWKEKWSRVEITELHGNRVMEVLFIDFGVRATVGVTELREIPPHLLKDFTIIPPQAIKCCLADLSVQDGDWSPAAVLWVKEAVQGSEDCKMKILKLDQHKGERLVHMYLFIGADSKELDKSINHQLAQSELWQKPATQRNCNTVIQNNSSVNTGLSDPVEKLTLRSLVPNALLRDAIKTHERADESSLPDTTTKTGTQPLPLPPPLDLPLPGQNVDVFVPVACHPGYFVLQPWQDLHKLVVLAGEMVLHYNQTQENATAVHIQKGEIYAAKIDNKWHRVQVKGILAGGLVSVYELDYGKHEFVRSCLLQPLIEEFRQLPFQAIAAQLAGMRQRHWSEEASMLFRNHVENKALVAQVESVQEASEVKGEPWERRLTVYLVDTGLDEGDLWIHSVMADIGCELTSAA